MAPELRTQGMSAASDMWALGCVGVCLLTGQTMEYRWKYGFVLGDRKSTRLNSSHLVISYAVFCLKKKRACSCVLLPSCIVGAVLFVSQGVVHNLRHYDHATLIEPQHVPTTGASRKHVQTPVTV